MNIADIGCGGGILSESMAAGGAKVTGIDMAETALNVAKLHLLESGLEVDYHHSSAEQFAQTHAQQFDIVTCMELLEHVPDPGSLISSCAQLVKPGGQVFFSTINRHPRAWLFAVIGAEYILNMLPRGTHDYEKFIKPSELGHWLRDAGLDINDLSGMSYNPLTRRYALSRDVQVNYLVHTRKNNNTDHGTHNNDA